MITQRRKIMDVITYGISSNVNEQLYSSQYEKVATELISTLIGELYEHTTLD